MTNSEISETVPEKPMTRLTREESRAAWLRCFSAISMQHSRDLAFQSTAWLKSFCDAEYDEEAHVLQCCFQKHERQYAVVTIHVQRPHEASVQFRPVCTCRRSNSQYLCEHTFAAISVLSREFSDKQSEMVEHILGPIEPGWFTALRTLDRLLTKPSQDVTDEVVKSRVAWRLQFKSNKELTVDLLDQTPSVKGGWNKGRVIAWNRVLEDTYLELLPADLEALRVLGDLRYRSWGPTQNQLGQMFEKLIGHPHIFYGTTPATVRKAQLGLMLGDSSESQDWTLMPTVEGRSVLEFDYFSSGNRQIGLACDVKRCEVLVIEAAPELWKVADELRSEPPTIPPDIQSEFVKRLPALEARFPVELPTTLKGEFVPAQQQLVLRLTPSDQPGATVEIQVNPAPNGSYFRPGEGQEEVSGQTDQGRVRVKRDFEGERSRAERLSKDLFLQRYPVIGLYGWKLDSDDQVLDLLDAVRARPENDPVVLWAETKRHRRMQVLGDVTPSLLRVEVKDQHDWFGLSGSIEIGGLKFPLSTLLAALKGGRRYLELGEGQYASISREFRDRLSSVTDMIHSNRGKLEFNATAAPILAELFNDEVTLKASKKWKESLKRLQKATNLEPVVPTTLMAELRDYQVEGYKWLRRLAEWGVGGCLADDMGLGKTVQAIAVLLDRREKGPTLIVAPVSVGFNWMREVEKFAPTLRPILYRDTDREDFLKTLQPGDLLITSYHLLQQHVSELAGIQWGTLVLDEAQAIKNSQTKTAQAVREIQADWRLALTGTPAENHLGDLWSVFRGVTPGLFGSWERFREVFADPIEKRQEVERKQALSQVLRPFVLRRTKSEVLKELPSRTEIQLTAELSNAERKLYEDTRLWAVTNLTSLVKDSDKDQRFQVLAALTKLRQLACHPRLVDKSWHRSSAKLDLFLETIDELREGRHRALVFSQFTQHLALIREALDEKKIRYQYLDGSTSPKKRQQAVEAFQAGEGELFLISLKAGGTGLNLTGADYVVHLDPWWNPAVEDQATDRAHRIGQTRPVTVYRLVAKETIEEQILKLHADKRGLISGILEGTDAAAKLSTTELINLIKLGGAAT